MNISDVMEEKRSHQRRKNCVKKLYFKNKDLKTRNVLQFEGYSDNLRAIKLVKIL